MGNGKLKTTQQAASKHRNPNKGKYIATRRQSRRLSYAKPRRIFDDVEERDKEEREKSLSPETTGSLTKLSVDGTTWPLLYAASLPGKPIFPHPRISCAVSSSPRYPSLRARNLSSREAARARNLRRVKLRAIFLFFIIHLPPLHLNLFLCSQPRSSAADGPPPPPVIPLRISGAPGHSAADGHPSPDL